jgi:hypothetical protein
MFSPASAVPERATVRWSDDQAARSPHGRDFGDQRRVRGSWLRQILAIALLLAGCAAPAAPRGPLPPVVAADGRLAAGGRPLEVRGVNYIHPSNADLARCPALQFGADGNCPWDPAPIRADLDQLRGLGVNTIRVFLNYYVFGGARAADPSYSMAAPLAHLDTLIAEANARGIYVLPVLLAKYPQDRFGPEGAQAALELHVRPVVQHLAGRPGILMWDLFNEPDIGSPVDIRCWDWDNADEPRCFPLAEERLRFVRTIHDEVKRLDPARLTTVSLAFAKNHAEPKEASARIADIVDVFSFHYYDNEPYDSGRYAAHWYYGQGFPADLRRSFDELRALGLGKPVLVSEIGFPSGPGHARTLADVQRDLRTARALARDRQVSGVVLWPFQPAADELAGGLFTG